MTTAVRSRSGTRSGSRFRPFMISQTNPTMLAVNESEIQEKVATNRTTMTHSRAVVVPTPTTLYIWYAP